MGFTPSSKTVKHEGADSGDILIGVSKNSNTGLIIKIFEKQQKDAGGPIVGAFRVLNEGTGNYSEGIKAVINSQQHFENFGEFIKLVQQQKDCQDCTHVLNANSLWKLDIKLIKSEILKEE